MRRWVRGEFDKWRHTTDEVISFSGSSAEIGGQFLPSAHAQRGLRLVVVCVCLSVCLSVSQSVPHLTSRVSHQSLRKQYNVFSVIRYEKYVGFSLKLLCSEFLCVSTTCCIIYTRVSSSDNSCLFVLTTVQYWSLDGEYNRTPSTTQQCY